MGSEANLRKKTGKLPVQLYRTFFKLSLAAVVYAVFCILMGGGDVRSASLATLVSILSALAYEIVFYIYKSDSAENKSISENGNLRQLKTILKFFLYLFGVAVVLTSSVLLYKGKIISVPLLLIGLACCQQMHVNKHLSSHLSTFFESMVIASVVITVSTMVYSLQTEMLSKYAWIFGVLATVLSEALAEFFFHIYNCIKHGKKEDKSSVRQRLKSKMLIIDRAVEFGRDLLLIFALFSVFGILISVGSVTLETFDIMVAVVPVVFSAVAPILESYKNSDKRAFDKYDPRIPPKELEKLLSELFTEEALSVKALGYVTKTMTAKNGHKRYNGEDYYVHPIAVAMLLLENTNADDEVIAAALLHDCIEDVDGCDKTLIEAEYGKIVANYVEALTKKEGVDYRKRENMQEYLGNILKIPEAALIKTADRINNVNTLENCTSEKKMRKYRETRMYYPSFVKEASEGDEDNSYFYQFAEKCFEENKY